MSQYIIVPIEEYLNHKAFLDEGEVIHSSNKNYSDGYNYTKLSRFNGNSLESKGVPFVLSIGTKGMPDNFDLDNQQIAIGLENVSFIHVIAMSFFLGITNEEIIVQSDNVQEWLPFTLIHWANAGLSVSSNGYTAVNDMKKVTYEKVIIGEDASKRPVGFIHNAIPISAKISSVDSITFSFNPSVHLFAMTFELFDPREKCNGAIKYGG